MKIPLKLQEQLKGKPPHRIIRPWEPHYVDMFYKATLEYLTDNRIHKTALYKAWGISPRFAVENLGELVKSGVVKITFPTRLKRPSGADFENVFLTDFGREIRDSMPHWAKHDYTYIRQYNSIHDWFNERYPKTTNPRFGYLESIPEPSELPDSVGATGPQQP